MSLFTRTELEFPDIAYEPAGMEEVFHQYRLLENQLQPRITKKQVLQELQRSFEAAVMAGGRSRRVLGIFRQRRSPWTKTDIFAERWKYLRGINKHIQIEYSGAWPMEKSFRKACGVGKASLYELQRLRQQVEQANRKHTIIANDINKCLAIKACQSIQRTNICSLYRNLIGLLTHCCRSSSSRLPRLSCRVHRNLCRQPLRRVHR